MRTVYTADHRLRDSKTELYHGALVPPFECPERAEIILARINEVKLGDVLGQKGYGLDPVLRTHDKGLVDFLASCWDEWQAAGYGGEAITSVWPTRTMRGDRIPTEIEGKLGYYALASETSISGGTWEAALASKNVALTATDMVLDGERAAFALCRPPGHHAAIDQFGGYCFLNNAAIAAQYALDKGAQRVAIIDIDFHHGNGTQHIFYQRDDVFYLSIHGDPAEAFPYYLGYSDEPGEGKGEGFNKNYPLPPGSDYSSWSEALDDACARIHNYSPDLLVVSHGVDAYEKDPISFFKIRSEDFIDCGARLSRLNLPTLFVMEGGYAVSEIGVNTVNVLSGFDD